MSQSAKQNIVNGFTFTRIIGIPFLFLFDGWVLLILANIMFFTDFLDGYFARKWGVVSTRGAILDLIADKLLVIVLLTTGLIDPDVSVGIIVYTLIVFREIYSMIIRFRAMHEGKELISASMVGKTKTTFQFIALSFMIMGWPGFKVLLWVVVCLSYYSFFGYFKKSKED